MPLLNESLASALGRPDLAFTAGSGVGTGAASMQGVPAGLSAGVGADVNGQFSGPVLTLMALVVGLGVFIYWVRPHLA
ncbi:MAG: hypothetical protein JWM85_3636 [Acidimicrobiaceae bacterium]|nr:hypothetical protein [Acidimicrobiaceae bacterium]